MNNPVATTAAGILRALLLLVPLTFARSVKATEAASRVVTYPAPAGASLNPDFTVRVSADGVAWQSVATYRIKVDEEADAEHHRQDSSVAYFDFQGQVQVEVTANRRPVSSIGIRPLALGIRPNQKGNTVRFTLDRPCNLSIEPDGDRFHNLQLFADRVEVHPPKPGDRNVIYFSPGIHPLDGGVLSVPSQTTVYLSGGCILEGRIVCQHVHDVRICGRGMLAQGDRKPGVVISNSRNVEVSGIFTPQCFTGGSQHVTIRDVKCISYLGNGDGMNVISSSDVLIDGVFNRNSDDCITVYADRSGYAGGSSEVTVENSTLWADVAHPILVGTHGNAEHPREISHLLFRNIDILDHNEEQIDYQGCLALDAGDANLIHDVRFEKIRVEDFRRGQLVNVRVFFNRKYCAAPGRGIENVVFKDISYSGTHAELSVIEGYDDTRTVRNIVFENLVINGRTISDAMDKPSWFKTSDLARFFVGEHVQGIVFRPTP